MTLPAFTRLLLATAACLGLATTVVACDEAEDDDGDESAVPMIDCETVTVPTYTNVALLNTCTNCHSSELTTRDERQNAPTAVNYDTYDAAVLNSTQGQREVAAGTMPPSDVAGIPLPTEAQKQDFYAWVQCGQPQ